MTPEKPHPRPPHTCTMSTHAYTYSLMYACMHTHMHARVHTLPTKSCMTVISSCSLFHPFLSLLSFSSLYTLLIPTTFRALSHPQCLCTLLGVLLYLEWFFPHSVQSKFLIIKTSTVRYDLSIRAALLTGPLRFYDLLLVFCMIHCKEGKHWP